MNIKSRIRAIYDFMWYKMRKQRQYTNQKDSSKLRRAISKVTITNRPKEGATKIILKN